MKTHELLNRFIPPTIGGLALGTMAASVINTIDRFSPYYGNIWPSSILAALITLPTEIALSSKRHPETSKISPNSLAPLIGITVIIACNLLAESGGQAINEFSPQVYSFLRSANLLSPVSSFAANTEAIGDLIPGIIAGTLTIAAIKNGFKYFQNNKAA